MVRSLGSKGFRGGNPHLSREDKMVFWLTCSSKIKQRRVFEEPPLPCPACRLVPFLLGQASTRDTNRPGIPGPAGETRRVLHLSQYCSYVGRHSALTWHRYVQRFDRHFGLLCLYRAGAGKITPTSLMYPRYPPSCSYLQSSIQVVCKIICVYYIVTRDNI